MRNLLLLLFSNILLSQNVYVKCLDNKINIPFASVLYKFNDEVLSYDYANKDGYLTLNNSLSFNQLEISCIGFENAIINKELITDTIYLKLKEILIDEVVITKRNNVKLVGLLNEKKKVEIGFSKGLEICLFFENSSESDLLIQSFLFNLNQKFTERTAVKLHIYEPSKARTEPGKEILTDNIVHILDLKNKKQIEIDLSNYSLFLPKEGAYIGVEFLGYIDNDSKSFKSLDYGLNSTKVNFNDKEKLPLTFIRNSVLKEKWTNTSALKKNLSKTIKFDNIPNVSFGLKVYQ